MASVQNCSPGFAAIKVAHEATSAAADATRARIKTAADRAGQNQRVPVREPLAYECESFPSSGAHAIQPLARRLVVQQGVGLEVSKTTQFPFDGLVTPMAARA